jgi:hypothetical protein
MTTLLFGVAPEWLPVVYTAQIFYFLPLRVSSLKHCLTACISISHAIDHAPSSSTNIPARCDSLPDLRTPSLTSPSGMGIFSCGRESIEPLSIGACSKLTSLKRSSVTLRTSLPSYSCGFSREAPYSLRLVIAWLMVSYHYSLELKKTPRFINCTFRVSRHGSCHLEEQSRISRP